LFCTKCFSLSYSFVDSDCYRKNKYILINHQLCHLSTLRQFSLSDIIHAVGILTLWIFKRLKDVTLSGSCPPPPPPLLGEHSVLPRLYTPYSFLKQGNNNWADTVLGLHAHFWSCQRRMLDYVFLFHIVTGILLTSSFLITTIQFYIIYPFVLLICKF